MNDQSLSPIILWWLALSINLHHHPDFCSFFQVIQLSSENFPQKPSFSKNLQKYYCSGNWCWQNCVLNPNFHPSPFHISPSHLFICFPCSIGTQVLSERQGIHLWWTFSSVSSVQSLSRVWLFATPWTAACQASVSITNSRSLLKLVSIESVMPSNHLILCHPLFLPPSIFPSIRIF